MSAAFNLPVGQQDQGKPQCYRIGAFVDLKERRPVVS